VKDSSGRAPNQCWAFQNGWGSYQKPEPIFVIEIQFYAEIVKVNASILSIFVTHD